MHEHEGTRTGRQDGVSWLQGCICKCILHVDRSADPCGVLYYLYWGSAIHNNFHRLITSTPITTEAYMSPPLLCALFPVSLNGT